MSYIIHKNFLCVSDQIQNKFSKNMSKQYHFFKRSWGSCGEQLLDDNIVTKRLKTVGCLLADCNGQQMSLKLLAESQSSVGQQLPNSLPTVCQQTAQRFVPRSCSISYLFVSFKIVWSHTSK